MVYLDSEVLAQRIEDTLIAIRQIRNVFWRTEDSSSRKTLANSIRRLEEVHDYLQVLAKTLPQV